MSYYLLYYADANFYSDEVLKYSSRTEVIREYRFLSSHTRRSKVHEYSLI